MIKMLFLILGVILSLFGLIYVYLTWNFNYWTNSGVPGPQPKVLFGSFKGAFLQKRNMLDDIEDIYNEYRGKAPYIGVFQSRRPQIMAIDPELVKNIFSRDFKNFQANEFGEMIDKKTDPIFGRNPFMLSGEEWKEKRAEITPAFTASRIKAMYPIIDDVCQKMTKYLDKQIKISNEFEAKELSSKYTIDVVSNCIYGIDSKSFTSSDRSEIREVAVELFKPSVRFIIYFTALSVFPFIKKIYTMPFVTKRIETFFKNLMSDAIDLRNKSKIDQNDYLNYLLELQRKKNISELDMAAHTITFFLDGFETSSAIISHVFFLLAQHKDCQDKLRAEISNLIARDGKITFENVNELEYLEQVFMETLRLYPPAGMLTKVCTSPIVFTDYKDKKVTIEKNTIAILPLWSIHRDPNNYPNADKFEPERFSAENGGSKIYKDKGSFFPFGDGPRQCLGMRFATVQSKSAIVELVRNFDISLSLKTQLPYVLDPKAFITQPVGGLWIQLKKFT